MPRLDPWLIRPIQLGRVLVLANRIPVRQPARLTPNRITWLRRFHLYEGTLWNMST